MDPTEVIKSITGAKIDHWTYTHQNTHGQPVDAGKCGFQPPNVWVKFQITENNQPLHITAERPVNGSAATITIGGKQFTGDMKLRKHLVFPGGVNVEVDLDPHDPAVGIYRFDGHVNVHLGVPLPGIP